MKCFFQLPGQSQSNGIDVQLVFKNNSAETAGSVLHGGAIDKCKITGLNPIMYLMTCLSNIKVTQHLNHFI